MSPMCMIDRCCKNDSPERHACSLSIASWLVALAGLWTLIAPAAISYAGLTASRTNDIVVGIVVLVLGVANTVYRQPARTV